MIRVFVLYGCVTWYDSLRKKEVFREKLLKKICESEKAEVNGTVGNCTLKNFTVLLLNKCYLGNRIEECETGGACYNCGVRSVGRY